MFSKKDIIVLGMMIFALFLGAGNIIFPPMEGYSAGNHWATAFARVCDNGRTHAIYYIGCGVSVRTW